MELGLCGNEAESRPNSPIRGSTGVIGLASLLGLLALFLVVRHCSGVAEAEAEATHTEAQLFSESTTEAVVHLSAPVDEISQSSGREEQVHRMMEAASMAVKAADIVKNMSIAAQAIVLPLRQEVADAEATYQDARDEVATLKKSGHDLASSLKMMNEAQQNASIEAEELGDQEDTVFLAEKAYTDLMSLQAKVQAMLGILQSIDSAEATQEKMDTKSTAAAELKAAQTKVDLLNEALSAVRAMRPPVMTQVAGASDVTDVVDPDVNGSVIEEIRSLPDSEAAMGADNALLSLGLYEATKNLAFAALESVKALLHASQVKLAQLQNEDEGAAMGAEAKAELNDETAATEVLLHFEREVEDLQVAVQTNLDTVWKQTASDAVGLAHADQALTLALQAEQQRLQSLSMAAGSDDDDAEKE